MRKIRRWCIGALVVMIALASGMIPGGRFASAAPGDNRAGFAGEGSAIRPYQIHNAEQLFAFSLYQEDYLSAHLELAADIDFAGWDWDARPWNPIGSNVSPFTGTFDGIGNTIRGLTVNRPDTSNTGMFGQIGEDSVIQRVSLIDANVKGQYSVGALAGYNERGTIRHVSVTGIVYGTDSHIGGVIGFSSFGNVSDAHADVDVTGTRFTGGLIGLSSSYILASSARGNVRGTTEVGGLVGTLTNSTIRYSYASGDVFGSGDAIGGLVGESYHTSLVEYSYATGNVSGNSYIGGLIGNIEKQDAIVLNNYASGNVEGEDQVGGIIGRNLGSVQYSYAYGKVQGKTVHAEIGGIVGVNHKEVEFSYWNSDANPGMSGVGVNENLGTSANLTGLTEMAFRQQHSFAHFDFDQDWANVEGVTTPYIKHPDADLTINEPDTVVELPGSGVLTVKGEIQTGASGDETFSIDYLVVNEDHVIVAEGSLQTGLEAGPFTINKPFTDVFPAAPGSRHTLWAWASAHATGTKPHSFSFVYPLPAPTGLTAIAGNRQAELQWDAVAVPGVSVTYAVYQYNGASAPTDPGDWTVAAGGLTDTSFTAVGLQNGSPYTFAVTAQAGMDRSELSTPVTVVLSSRSGSTSSPSADSRLRSLGICVGDTVLPLEPAFDPGTTSYTAHTDTERIELKLAANDYWATVRYEGTKVEGDLFIDLVPGEQELVFVVTAENGEERTYTIAITRHVLVEDDVEEDTAPPAFSDIAGHWAERRIAEAVRRGIVSGYPDGTFRPDASITRAEFTALVARVMQLPEPSDATIDFTDQAQIGAWARKAVAQAVAAGIISGFDDGRFAPNEPLTRQQMAVILARAMDLQLSAGGAASYADAADIAEWARAAVGALQERGYMIGRGDNRFHPQAMTTRAEAVVVLLELLLT